MDVLASEIRLGLLLLALAAISTGAVMIARRISRDLLQMAVDALLIIHLAQYLAVAIPGAAGALSGWAVLAMSLILAALLAGIALRLPLADELPHLAVPHGQRWIMIGCCALAIGLIAAPAWHHRMLPPLANDVLAYHFPAAVQWLQDGRLGVFETWTYDPTAAYSPLAGSVLAAWWMALLGNDMLARFVQAPAALLLLAAAMRVVRQLGAPLALAALLGLGIIAARPMIGQVIIARDDLLLVALFVAAMSALSVPEVKVKGSRRAQALRLGVALGLLLATKYAALYVLPVLLLAIDAPLRSRWRRRHYLTTAGVVALLAGPWYLRNLVLTGNPLFPMDLPGLGGILQTGRAAELHSLRGVLEVLVLGHDGTGAAVGSVMVMAWIVGWLGAGRLREPLMRVVMLGPVVGLVLFVLLAPYAEPRFAYVPLVLLMLAPAVVTGWRERVGAAAGGALAAGAVATAFAPERLAELAVAILLITMAAGAGLGLIYLLQRHRRALMALGLLGAAGLAGWIYAEWSSAEQSYLYGKAGDGVAGDASATERAWRDNWGALGEAWAVVRAQDENQVRIIAYAHTHLVYPLQGREGSQRIVYAPVQPGISAMQDLPPLGDGAALAGDQILLAMVSAQAAGADERTWLANLAALNADLLFIGKADPTGTGQAPAPIELRWARRFDRIFENEAAAIYRLRR